MYGMPKDQLLRSQQLLAPARPEQAEHPERPEKLLVLARATAAAGEGSAHFVGGVYEFKGFREYWGVGRVAALLQRQLIRERATWRPRKYRLASSQASPHVNASKGGEEISGAQRDLMIRWFASVTSGLQLPGDVLFLASGLLDEFLQRVRARPRYLQVIACSCFLLAAKILLDDDNVPALADLIRSGGCVCSVSEARRMEKLILDHFHWDIMRPTALDFLHAYHALLANYCEPVLGPEGPDQVTSLKVVWEAKLVRLLLAHNAVLADERPSTVALALVSLEVEALTPDWLFIVKAIQALQADCRDSGDGQAPHAQLAYSNGGFAAGYARATALDEVVRCRVKMARHLQRSGRRVLLLSERRQASKRKMQTSGDGNSVSAFAAGGDNDLADQIDATDCIYDSIKKLYADHGDWCQPTVAPTLGPVVSPTAVTVS